VTDKELVQIYGDKKHGPHKRQSIHCVGSKRSDTICWRVGPVALWVGRLHFCQCRTLNVSYWLLNNHVIHVVMGRGFVASVAVRFER